MTNSDDRGSHVLIIPYPAQGHLIPILDLTHQLAIRGLTITMLVTPKNTPCLNPILAKHPSIEILILPFPGHPSIPPGVENGKDLPPNSTHFLIGALSELYDPLLEWFKSNPIPPEVIISDMFLGWTNHLACHLGIRRIVFSPSGAFALSIMYSLWSDLPKRDEKGIVSFPKIPNCPKYPWWHLSPMYRAYVKGDPFWEYIKDGFRADMASWGLVVNSFTELEGKYLDYLKKEMGHDRVWAVGPLLPSKEDKVGPAERGGSSSELANEIMTWLDRRRDHQVVYVCFGSQAVLRNDQMEAVASGLEQSGVHFILCVKEPTKGHEEGKYGQIPSGFEERVASSKKGLIIKGWAPQVMILGHRAIGAFLTHCGWNSVLEALIGGVPMLAWPMMADQFFDATLLVDELKVGAKVCEGANSVPSSTHLARVFADSVTANRLERRRARELKKAATDAIKEGGSSIKGVDALLKHLVFSSN